MGVEVMVNHDNLSKVAILMSTYNGEKYIEEQIISIMKQSFHGWKLYIRDDGSSDNTMNIVKKIAKKDERIKIIDSSQNIGVVQSFFYLLKNVHADVYFFADQDDVWDFDKVRAELAVIKKHNNDPCVVYTNLEIVDEQLVKIKSKIDLLKLSKLFKKHPEMYYTDNIVTGCTICFNNKLKEKISFEKDVIRSIRMHDWWITMIASAFGKIIFLNKKTVRYRQHESNVVGANKRNSILKAIKSVKLTMKQYRCFVQHYDIENSGSRYFQTKKHDLIKRCEFIMRGNFKFGILKNIEFKVILCFFGDFK